MRILQLKLGCHVCSLLFFLWVNFYIVIFPTIVIIGNPDVFELNRIKIKVKRNCIFTLDEFHCINVLVVDLFLY